MTLHKNGWQVIDGPHRFCMGGTKYGQVVKTGINWSATYQGQTIKCANLFDAKRFVEMAHERWLKN